MTEATLCLKALSAICSSVWKCVFWLQTLQHVVLQLPSLPGGLELWTACLPQCNSYSLPDLLWTYVLQLWIFSSLISRFNYVNYSSSKYIFIKFESFEKWYICKNRRKHWSAWGTGLRSWRLGFGFVTLSCLCCSTSGITVCSVKWGWTSYQWFWNFHRHKNPWRVFWNPELFRESLDSTGRCGAWEFAFLTHSQKSWGCWSRWPLKSSPAPKFWFCVLL